MMKHKETLTVRSKTTLGRTKRKKKKTKNAIGKLFALPLQANPIIKRYHLPILHRI